MRAGIESTAAAPSQPDCPGGSRSDNSARSDHLAAIVGSIPALALSHSQKVNKNLLLFVSLSLSISLSNDLIKGWGNPCMQTKTSLLKQYVTGERVDLLDDRLT